MGRLIHVSDPFLSPAWGAEGVYSKLLEMCVVVSYAKAIVGSVRKEG